MTDDNNFLSVLAEQEQLLADGRALVEDLRRDETSAVQLVREKAEAQLRAQAAEIMDLAEQLAAARRQGLSFEADLMVSTTWCEELTVINRRLLEELAWLKRQLLAQRASGDKLREDLRLARIAAEDRALSNATLQSQLDDLRHCVRSVEDLERQVAVQEATWREKEAVALSQVAALQAEKAAAEQQAAHHAAALETMAADRAATAAMCEAAQLEAAGLRADLMAGEEDRRRLLARQAEHDELAAELDGRVALLEQEREERQTTLQGAADRAAGALAGLHAAAAARRQALQTIFADNLSAPFDAALLGIHPDMDTVAPTEGDAGPPHAQLLRHVARLEGLRNSEEAAAKALSDLAAADAGAVCPAALAPLLRELFLFAAEWAGEPPPPPTGPLDAPGGLVRCLALLTRLREVSQTCPSCHDLHAQMAGQQRRQEQGWVAEEARQRRATADHNAEVRDVLKTCLGWMTDYEAGRQRLLTRMEMVKKWDGQERQQRRTIVAAEAEAWAKLWGMAQRQLKWRAVTDAKNPDRRRPTVAWIGIEIAEGRAGEGMESRPGTPSGDDSPEEKLLLGVKIVGVKGPAARQGVQVGDVILSLNDRPIHGLSNFKCSAAKVKPGQTVHLTIARPNVQERVLISVQTSELDKEQFTPGLRHSHRVPIGRPEGLRGENGRDKENRDPVVEDRRPSQPDAEEAAKPGSPRPPRTRCRSGPISVRGTTPRPR